MRPGLQASIGIKDVGGMSCPLWILALVLALGSAACAHQQGHTPKASEKEPPTVVGDDAALATSKNDLLENGEDQAQSKDAERFIPASIPKKARLWHARGLRVLGEDPKEALKIFIEAVEMGGANFYLAHHNQGVALQRLGRFEEAQAAHTRALTIQEDFHPARAALVGLLQMEGKALEAKEALKKAWTRWPEAAEFRGLNALDHAQNGAFEEAKDLALQALRIDEDDISALLALGAVFYGQKKMELARMALDEVLARDPQHGAAHNVMGLIWRDLGELGFSRDAFAKATEAWPKIGAFWNNRGVAEIDLGAFENALRSLEQACALQSEDARFALNRGTALRGVLQVEPAVEAFKLAAKLDPNLGAAYYNLGIVYLDGGFKALDEIKRHTQALAALSQAEKLLGEKKVAAAALRAKTGLQEAQEADARRQRRRERLEARAAKAADAAAAAEANEQATSNHPQTPSTLSEEGP